MVDVFGSLLTVLGETAKGGFGAWGNTITEQMKERALKERDENLMRLQKEFAQEVEHPFAKSEREAGEAARLEMVKEVEQPFQTSEREAGEAAQREFYQEVVYPHETSEREAKEQHEIEKPTEVENLFRGLTKVFGEEKAKAIVESSFSKKEGTVDKARAFGEIYKAMAGDMATEEEKKTALATAFKLSGLGSYEGSKGSLDELLDLLGEFGNTDKKKRPDLPAARNLSPGRSSALDIRPKPGADWQSGSLLNPFTARPY